MNAFCKSSIPLLIFVLVGCFSANLELPAQSKEPDKILFLHLRMKDGAITLTKTVTAPGVLKPRRGSDKKGPLEIELQNAEGAFLWSEAMSDPSVRRYEYEDPDNPGAIKFKVVQLSEVEFTVRVPSWPEGRRVSFYRVEPSAKPNRVAAASEFKSARPAKQLITTIDLPVEEPK